MTNIGPEGTSQDTFSQNLGQILSVMADRHPTPDDETAMRFVGQTADGGVGVSSCSPRQYAEAVLYGTLWGANIVNFYREISANLGDPTGQRVIDDLRSQLLPEDTSASNWL